MVFVVKADLMYENIISYLGLPDTKNPNRLGFGFYLQFMMRQVWALKPPIIVTGSVIVIVIRAVSAVCSGIVRCLQALCFSGISESGGIRTD